MTIFREPPIPPDLLERPRLTGRFALGPGAPDAAIRVPPGTGRTSQLLDIARSARRAGFALAWLDGTGIDAWRAGGAWPAGSSGPDATVDPADDRSPAGHRIVLIDDADLIDPRPLDLLLARLRPGQVILTTATDPRPGIPAPVTEADLRFTEAESALCLEKACADPAALHRLCQGQALALRLVRGLLDRGLPLSPEVLAGPPVGANLPHWLDTALWPTLPPEVRRFLFAIAPLDQVDGDMAFAATGGRDAWALLDRLGPLGIPVERRDPMTGGLRLHPLFRDYVLRCARRDGVETNRPLRAVAGWLGGRGQFLPAAQMAMRAGDPEQARHWIGAEGGWRVVIRGDGGWLSRLCEGVPPADLAARPGLVLGLALHLSRMGDPSGARDLIAGLPPGPDVADDRLIVESIPDGYDDRPFGP